MEVKELQNLYGKAEFFSIAYGIGNDRLAEMFKQKPRIAKKKVKKLRSVWQSANYVFGIDRGETFTLKAKYKKGCRKGFGYVKVFCVKDKTVYCHVVKHRTNINDNKIENLEWVPSKGFLKEVEDLSC